MASNGSRGPQGFETIYKRRATRLAVTIGLFVIAAGALPAAVYAFAPMATPPLSQHNQVTAAAIPKVIATPWKLVKPTATPLTKATARTSPTPGSSATPIVEPTGYANAGPIILPTATPTGQPTTQPTTGPTYQPTAAPTAGPTGTPTAQPTAQPTATASQPPVGVAGASFVSPSGSDAAAGTIDAPWRTLQHAADVATGTVYVRGGSYSGFTVTRSGLSFLAYSGETPIVNGGAGRTDVVVFRGVTSATISGFTIQGNVSTYGCGIHVDGSSGVLISGNLVRNNHSFGIGVFRSGTVRIDANELTANDTGVEIEYGLAGNVVSHNSIHDNQTQVDESRGRDGVNVYYTSGATTISANSFVHNGTHIEYYNSSNITISDNTLRDGSVLESGTDPGGTCRNITFVRNVASRTNFGEYSDGIILRCASDSLFANNTLSGLDTFGFDVVDGTQGIDFGGSIAGLRVVNNIILNGRAFSIDNTLPASVVIDRNLSWGTSSALYADYVAYVAGRGNTGSLATFRSWTGYQANGLQADPKLADAAFHLSAGSPAIDRGAILPGIAYTGSAPDLGCWER